MCSREIYGKMLITGVWVVILTVIGISGRHAFGRVCLPQDEISFDKGTWSHIVDLAKKSHKYIFVDVSAAWCLPCRQLERESFKSADIAQYYNKHFINYAIDAEKGEGIQLAGNWNITAYPTLLFFNTDGKLIMQETGFVDSAALLDLGKQALSRK